ncbi:MAG: creatininase family protein [Chloroflexia bacterium]|nr:creatininase family protein [Chloroflexia bacterium]
MMLLAEMTWRQVAAYLEKDDRIMLPVGSTEQHGPRAVLGTDFIAPAGIAAQAGQESGVLVAPAVPYGMALHHMAFPGTMSLRPSSLQLLLYDLLSSLARHGFRRVLLLNGHGGNVPSLMAAIAEVNDVHQDLRLKLRSWWELPGVQAVLNEAFGDKEGGHGTPGETSLVMAMRPGIVSDEPVEVHAVNRPPVWLNARLWAETFADGSAGADANLASADWGRRLLQAAVTDLLQELEQW